MINENIDRYKIISRIGAGKSSTVYSARDPLTSREVAIKVLLWGSEYEARKRFYKEMQVAASLEHSAIVPIYDVGVYEDRFHIVMRYMRGGTLKKRLLQGPFSPEEASQFLDRMSSALDYIHSAGLVHSNIKPGNVLLDRYGMAYLCDFGILDGTGTIDESFFDVSNYMAPEQMTTKKVDNFTDIYQLGLVLFEILTGKHPFQDEISSGNIQYLHSQKVPSLSAFNSNLSTDYDKVIFRALAKTPSDRYVTASEMAQEFNSLVFAAAKTVDINPVDNPFVVGNPVSGNLFVGRTKIISQLQELWGSDTFHNVNSVVLFGHRRMGKTSILQNLHHYFRKKTVVAGFTMQRVGRVNSTGELLNYLALAIFDALEDAGFRNLSEPDPAKYELNGYLAFNRFLREIGRRLTKNKLSPKDSDQNTSTNTHNHLTEKSRSINNEQINRIILTIDEFELIEDAIIDGRVNPEFLDFLRGVIHSEHWLILALAGLHTLEEMTSDYWNPLYASVTPVRISFFSRTATSNLLGDLGKDFPLKFTNSAVDKIFELVQGQPYLTQLIAYKLVSTYNQAIFEHGEFQSPEFIAENVVKIVESIEFFNQGRYYFNGVWAQAEKSDPKGQISVMRTIAKRDSPINFENLSAKTNLEKGLLDASIKKLQHHDVIKQLEDNYFDFTVPLMRLWIRKEKL